jgi:hypothetical protein
LKDENFQKIDEFSKDISSGYNLQVIGSDRQEQFSTSTNNTKFVFINSYYE